MAEDKKVVEKPAAPKKEVPSKIDILVCEIGGKVVKTAKGYEVYLGVGANVPVKIEGKPGKDGKPKEIPTHKAHRKAVDMLNSYIAAYIAAQYENFVKLTK